MHKISNITGQARHGWDRMTPAAFGMSRPQTDVSNSQPFRQPHGLVAAASSTSSSTSPSLSVNHAFNVPFASNLAGPEREDVIHSSPGAFERWTFSEGTDEDIPIHKLPVHLHHIEALRSLCHQIREQYAGRVEAHVISSELKASLSLQRRPSGQVTNVCVSGDGELVRPIRARILNETPIALRSATVEIDPPLIIDGASNDVRTGVLCHLDRIASYTGTDIFLLRPKKREWEISDATYGGEIEGSLDQRYRVLILGDMESVEHAKTRVLMMIDQILKHKVDVIKLELTMHTLVCGRTRKNIKLIESATKTAIYFPPPFLRIHGYVPPGATRRSEDEVFITGETQENIQHAKQKLRELVSGIKLFVKDVILDCNKIDSILLDRLDKVRRVMEANGSYVLFPPLGSQRGMVRVQSNDVLHVERTVREIMALAGQFYSASWWVMIPKSLQGSLDRLPSMADVRIMLSDICINSGAEISYEQFTFSMSGSDDAVKAAMAVIHQIPFVNKHDFQLRVKTELANEHKEFVSGKKNGKINKIMGQSNVQIMFDGFNEYNFYIDVCGTSFEAVNNGLELVEQEMPASIAFHVPDQYHKRIIGMGGQHIQRIMKKHSVFVKFSNAMDRGGPGREDDDVKVDNVVCRTPSRNAQSLDLVKQEIMDMVEKVDAEFVSETVIINRLYQRELIARMDEIEQLEKRWNCKIDFPNTEQASDVVTISGPEYQVPQALDAFLGMVPEEHEIAFQNSDELSTFFTSAEFSSEVRQTLRERYEVDVHINGPYTSTTTPSVSTEKLVSSPEEECLVLTYTRNNAGGVKDAIDFLVSRLVTHGLDATTVKGAIPRPQSDSFEESLPFFDSKLLHNAPSIHSADSPTRSTFGDADNVSLSDRASLFERLRKPGSISSISSFISRKNQSSSNSQQQQQQHQQQHHHPPHHHHHHHHHHHKNNSSTPSFFKYASSNASRASLVSMESRDSGYHNPWNDSGINLPEGDVHVGGWPPRFDTTKFSSSFAGTAMASAVLNSGSNNHNNHSNNHDTNNPISATATANTPGVGVGVGVGVSAAATAAAAAAAATVAATGDSTPRHDPRASFDELLVSGSPSTTTTTTNSTSNSSIQITGYPVPIGPPTHCHLR